MHFGNEIIIFNKKGMKYLQITLLAQVFTELAHECGTKLLTKRTYTEIDLKTEAKSKQILPELVIKQKSYQYKHFLAK